MVCVERAPALDGWKAWRWAGRTRGVWRDIFPLFFSVSVSVVSRGSSGFTRQMANWLMKRLRVVASLISGLVAS